jgi:hypothetical protein
MGEGEGVAESAGDVTLQLNFEELATECAKDSLHVRFESERILSGKAGNLLTV